MSATTKALKDANLTAPQLEILKSGLRRENHEITTYGTQGRTFQALLTQGYIQRVLRYNDTERAERAKLMDTAIADAVATLAISHGNWRIALDLLRQADKYQTEISATMLRLTETGRNTAEQLA